MPLSLVVRMVLRVEAANTYNNADVNGCMGTVKLLCHVVIHLAFAMVTGQNGKVTSVEKTGV